MHKVGNEKITVLLTANVYNHKTKSTPFGVLLFYP